MNNIIKPNNYIPAINSNTVIESNKSNVQQYKDKYLKVNKYLSEFKNLEEKLEARKNLDIYSKGEINSKIKEIRTDLGEKEDSPNLDGNAFERINYLLEVILELLGEGDESIANQIKKAVDELKGGVSSEYDTLKKIEDIIKVHILNIDNPHNTTKTLIGLGNVTNDAQVKRSEMGQPLGVALLDESGKIPSKQLPSYVDDVIDCYATFEKSEEGLLTNILLYDSEDHSVLIIGETGKIYADIETSYLFRWTGTLWGVVGAPTVIGTATGTAFDGKKGKDLEDKTNSHISNTRNPHNVTPLQIGAVPTGGLKTINSNSLEGEGNINVENVYIGDTSPEGDNYKLFVEINEEAEVVEVYTKLETDSKFAEKTKLDKASFISDLEEEYPLPETKVSDTATKALQDWNGNNIVETYATKNDLSSKLNTLVSGTNIKTINNQELLGQGNITFKEGIDPDDEDIINSNNKLKFADRAYDLSLFSGKGYKILRKNVIDGKNILSQDMINLSNTVYEIRYDFNLGGEEITVPEGCTFKFEGGSLEDGTIIFNNTHILLGLEYIFKNININGSYNFDTIYINVKNYGAKGDGITNDTPFILKAINNHKKVFLPKGIYKLETPIYVSSLNEIIGDKNLSIVNTYSTILKPNTVAITYNEVNSITQNQDIYISNIGFDGGTNCIDLPLTHLLNINNCTFKNFTGCGIVHVRGERIYLNNLYFTVDNTDANKAISLANSNDSIYKDKLDSYDFGSEGLWCDRILLSKINIISLNSGKFINGIYCNGGLSNCTTNNIVIMGTRNTPFYANYIQYSIIKSITFDTCGLSNVNADYGFCANNIKNSTLIGISPNIAGNCNYNITFYIGYGYNTSIIDCIATKTKIGNYGFRIKSNANRSILFLNCGGLFSDESTSLIYRSLLLFIGCNFKETDNNLGNNINNKYGDFTIQFNNDDNGSKEYENPVFNLIRNVGSGNSKSFFKSLKDRIVISDKLHIIYGDIIPENNILGTIGSIYIKSDGKIFIKKSNTTNVDWELLYTIENKGTTEQRPSLTVSDEGFEYYDSTLKKKVLWNGTEWTNLDGTTLA